MTISFTSSSGYNNFKDIHPFDVKLYSPIDISWRVNQWLDIVNPKLVVIAQNEIWPSFLRSLNRRKTPFIYVDSYFQNTWKNKFWLKWNRHKLNRARFIFTPSTETYDFLDRHLKCEVIQTGSLRNEFIFDSLSKKTMRLPKVEKFKGEDKLLILGSIEPSDLSLLGPLFKKLSDDWKLVIAPHDITSKNINEILNHLDETSVCYYSKEVSSDFRFCILDEFGILKLTYRHADMIYIGGGFGRGVHNLIEPAYWDKPVISGPIIKSQVDKTFLEERALLTVINGVDDFLFALKNMGSIPKSYHENIESNTTEYLSKKIIATLLISQRNPK